MKWYIYLLNVSLFKKQVNGILVYIFDIRFSLFLLLLYKSLHLIWHRFHQNSIHFCYLFFLFWRLRIFSRELVYFHKKKCKFFWMEQNSEKNVNYQYIRKLSFHHRKQVSLQNVHALSNNKSTCTFNIKSAQNIFLSRLFYTYWVCHDKWFKFDLFHACDL